MRMSHPQEIFPMGGFSKNYDYSLIEIWLKKCRGWDLNPQAFWAHGPKPCLSASFSTSARCFASINLSNIRNKKQPRFQQGCFPLTFILLLA